MTDAPPNFSERGFTPRERMVDKIDRPNPYAVGGTTETKRDKPQDQRGQEDLPTYKQQSPSLYREKFQSEAGASRTIRVPLGEIQKMTFRRATPRHGAPTAEANLLWKDGRVTEDVSFLIRNWQDFLKIKNLKPGDVIPENFWHYNAPTLEITVRQVTTSGSWNLREMEKKADALQKAPEDKVPLWQRAEFYAIGAVVLVIVAMAVYLMRI